MKGKTALISAIIMATALISGCKEDLPELKVTVNQESIQIKAGKPAEITYSVINNDGDITVELRNADSAIIAQNTFNKDTRTGTITISTSSSSSSENNSNLIFSDGRTTIEKNISIRVSSSWSVEPDEPIQ